jgi:hypothetical protein
MYSSGVVSLNESSRANLGLFSDVNVTVDVLLESVDSKDDWLEMTDLEGDW